VFHGLQDDEMRVRFGKGGGGGSFLLSLSLLHCHHDSPQLKTLLKSASQSTFSLRRVRLLLFSLHHTPKVPHQCVEPNWLNPIRPNPLRVGKHYFFLFSSEKQVKNLL